MTTLAHLFAAIGIFFGSLFGGHQAAPVPVAVATTSEPTAESPVHSLAPHLLSDMSLTDRDHSHLAISGGMVYYQGTVIPGADPNTFEFLPFASALYGTRDSGYVKDANHVWYVYGTQAIPVPGADAATFVPLGYGGGEHGGAGEYGKDKNHVYFGFDYKVTAISSDPSHFVMGGDASGDDAHDSSHYYLEGGLQNGDLYVNNNNLYLHGTLVAKNIPSTLGLDASTLGQPPSGMYGFSSWYSYWPFDNRGWGGVDQKGSADLYESVATSSDGSLAAFVYSRESEGDDGKQSFDHAWIIVSSAQGLIDTYSIDSIDASTPDFIYIAHVDQSQVLFSVGNFKGCYNILHKLTIPGNQLVNLGEDPKDADCDNSGF